MSHVITFMLIFFLIACIGLSEAGNAIVMNDCYYLGKVQNHWYYIKSPAPQHECLPDPTTHQCIFRDLSGPGPNCHTVICLAVMGGYEGHYVNGAYDYNGYWKTHNEDMSMYPVYATVDVAHPCDYPDPFASYSTSSSSLSISSSLSSHSDSSHSSSSVSSAPRSFVVSYVLLITLGIALNMG
jgi:hypothetical protein